MELQLPRGCQLRCRGCSHRTWSPEESESQKYRWLRSQLENWEKVLEPVRGVHGEARWHYRGKTCLHAQWKNDHWSFGLLAPVSEGVYRDFEVVDIPECPIHSPFIQKVCEILAWELPSQTELPLVFLAVSGTLVTLVVKSSHMPMLPQLDWRELGITGVFINLNPSAGNRVYSSRGWMKIWGNQYGMEDGLFYGPNSFQQLIPSLHRESLDEAVRFLDPGPGAGVIDFCSGFGLSLGLWRKAGADCVGIELSGEAVNCANLNLGQGYCLRGRASERLPQLEDWIAEKRPQPIFIYANPPRLGLEEEVLRWIVEKAKPKRIAYLSCSAGTLARDLTFLTSSGYKVQRIIPYDFFPQTHHVEALALLYREELDSPAFLSGPVCQWSSSRAK